MDLETNALGVARWLLGIDVGSTTVKVVAVDPRTKEIVWSDYQRHETRQAEKALQLLEALQSAIPEISSGNTGVFLTGSGSRALTVPLGGRFVQEVNAVTLAVEELHPDVGSVVELGGQDAKIIIFRKDPRTGDKQVTCSMNDKCASGTGATIDKCLIKVGLSPEQVGSLSFDAGKLHKVAAKCGVFAETDIVNLMKSGIPSEEIICSLADAIVSQNLSVLARGNTLLPGVLLLGGPNHYLRFLQECWRLRIPEIWKERGYTLPENKTLEELIFVPPNANFYAAYGAVLYGLARAPGADDGSFRGLDPLREYVAAGSRGGALHPTGPPLINNDGELAEFLKQYSLPVFRPAEYASGSTVHAAIGIDGGSTSSKLVVVDEGGRVLAKAYRLSKGNPIQDMRELLKEVHQDFAERGLSLDVAGFGVTGYAADVIGKAVDADVNIVETVAHMISAVDVFGEVDVICDIGGQDIKVLFMQHGNIRDFRLSNQCSAGNGMLLQAMAAQFGIPIADYAGIAFKALRTPIFSYGCAVFLDADRVNFQKDGFSKEELLAGLAMVLPKNIWQYVVQIPRMAELGRRFVLQGGTQYNLAAVKAQVDYIRSRVPGAEVHVHPHCGEAGAVGAAIEAWRVVKRRGSSSFVGLDYAMRLEYTTHNDDSTQCHFCSNRCARTFIDTTTPDGRTTRCIAGFSCEKGTVESADSLRTLVSRRKQLDLDFANLLDQESRICFQSSVEPAALPEAGAEISEVIDSRRWTGRRREREVLRPFHRSGKSAEAVRRRVRIGIPRVLSLYSTAPLFRAYFETLGVLRQNIVFSPPTSEKLYSAGARYGSVDTCFPSKVVQSHLHHLLFETHKPGSDPLHYLFFPSVTCLPTFIEHALDSTSCPIVAGTPNVMKAAFNREIPFFERAGIEYVDGVVTLEEPHYFKRQMFEMWGERLQITEDESDFAVDQGWAALGKFDAEMQQRGREVLEQVEAENRIAILVLGRPYHADPGLNHGLLDELQALGYPVITMRSIPKDEKWLARWFQADIEAGLIESTFDIRDVWPENYSTNSAQKVWAAKFAARHPHVAVLDLSSFKCGYDAPIYGLIDQIMKAGETPCMAMHDLDANKPAGSQKIRVRTFAYTLQRYQEQLEDRARRMKILQECIESKRGELLAETGAASYYLTPRHDPAVTTLNRDFPASRAAGPASARGIRMTLSAGTCCGCASSGFCTNQGCLNTDQFHPESVSSHEPTAVATE